MPKLLVIDDNKGVTEILEEVARDVGYEVLSVNDYKEIRSSYVEFQPDLIFLDLDLGVDADMDMSEKGYDGLTVFQFFEKVKCPSKIVLVSGMGKQKRMLTKNIGHEMELDVIGSIGKPFSIDLIEQVLVKLKGGETAKF
ncbi:MAG: response regulator [Pseudohongiella sp.]|nr:response regulator [Pseudohongiella sp.]